jgi:fructoselysine-6-P-deglycase FrlB-like protein
MEKSLEIYKLTLEKAIGYKENIERAIQEILKKEIKNIYLLGCGGSLGVMFPCKYILDINCSLPVYVYNASEFLSLNPKNLDKKSLVILSSYTGETKETVDSAKYVKKIGASTIGFTGEENSSLGKNVDYVFANNSKEGVTDSKLIMLYQVIFNIIKRTDNYDRYDEIMDTLSSLPENLVKIKEKVEEQAIEFAKKNKDEKFFMTLGSGPCWVGAYMFATCFLEEMQWIKAQPVNAGEYFHGAFEIVREDTNLIIFKGEDRTRSLIDRAEKFSRKYSKKITLIDTKDFELPGVPDDFRGYLSPLVLLAVMDVYAKKLAEQRNHPLKIRKYMGKVEY